MSQVMSRCSSATESTPPPRTDPRATWYFSSPSVHHDASSIINSQQENPPHQRVLSDQQFPFTHNHLPTPSSFLSFFSSTLAYDPTRPSSLPPPEPSSNILLPTSVPAPSAEAASASSPFEAAPFLTPLPPPPSTAPMSISCTKYRVGLPPVRPLPLQNSYDMSGVYSDDKLCMLYEKVADILVSHGIKRPENTEAEDLWEWAADPWQSDDGSDCSVYLVDRSIPDVPNSGRLTLLITTDWTDSSGEDWKLAVQDIRPLVLRFLDIQEVDVEMIATYLTALREIGPLGHYPLIQDNWDTMSGEIKKVLQSHASSRDTMTAITVFRMGYDEKHEDNPVVVYVSVSHDCPEASWPSIIDDINGILEPYPVELFFEHNYWKPATLELVPPASNKFIEEEFTRRPYQECPSLGADIGAAQYIELNGRKRSPPMGTLGCYVDFKTKRGEQKTMALTNYHVCRPCVPGFTLNMGRHGIQSGMPPSGSPLRKADRRGIGPKHGSILSDMEHPSRVRHNLNVARLALERNFENEKIKSEVERKLDISQRAFHKNANILGKVWAASGYDRRSTATDSFLDWALVEVQRNRQGRNLLPDYSTWENMYSNFHWPHPEGMENLKMYRQDTTLSRLAPGTKVYKYGACTGLTVGHFQNLMVHTSAWMVNGNPTRRPTTAYAVESIGNRQFSSAGDSGAIVYDQEGHALGMVFSKLHPRVAKGEDYLTWVMAMDQIFEDIKTFCEVTDLQISPVVGSPPN